MNGVEIYKFEADVFIFIRLDQTWMHVTVFNIKWIMYKKLILRICILLFWWHDECHKFWSKQNQDKWKVIQKYSYLLHWICDDQKP